MVIARMLMPVAYLPVDGMCVYSIYYRSKFNLGLINEYKLLAG